MSSKRKKLHKSDPFWLRPKREDAPHQPQMVDGLLLQRLHHAPETLSPQNVLQLQRLYGNQAMGQVLQRVRQQTTSSPVDSSGLHDKESLTVGPTDDQHEQQADQMADSMMPHSSTTLQRDSATHEDGFEVGSDFQSQLARSGGGTPLPGDIQADFGSKMGTDLSKVRVHTDGQSAKLNKQIQAKAFTHGSDIYMGAGQYNPASDKGKHLLAHEVTHTVQQGGAVQRKVIQRWPWSKKEKPKNSFKLQKGDILLHKANWKVQGAQAVAGFGRLIAKTAGAAVTLGMGGKYAVKEVARFGNVKFGHAVIATSSMDCVHATSDGVKGGGIPKGDYLVYRSTDSSLATKAGNIANKWLSSGKIKYGLGTALLSAFQSSRFSYNRAITLALYTKYDLAPKSLICSEFAISAYQAAAMEPLLDQLDLGQLKQEMAGDKTAVDKKRRVRHFARGIKGIPGMGKAKDVATSHTDVDKALKLDPRTSTPQRLASKLEVLSTKRADPQWQKVGWYYK